LSERADGIQYYVLTLDCYNANEEKKAKNELADIMQELKGLLSSIIISINFNLVICINCLLIINFLI
jgi:hypothetical protein